MNKYDTLETKVTSPFLQKHSAAIRIWHWLTFIIISFLIITVLFDSTMFSPWENTAMVKNVLKENNVVVLDEQAKAVAHEYSDKLWDLHKYLGFALTFLFLARIIIEITASPDEKIRTRINNALSLYRQNVSNKKDLQHYRRVKYSYTAFYLLVLFLVLTGLLLAFGHERWLHEGR